jgi:hypothetical protein
MATMLDSFEESPRVTIHDILREIKGNEVEDSEARDKIICVGVMFDVTSKVRREDKVRVRDCGICKGEFICWIVEVISRATKSVNFQFPEI